MNEPSDSSEYFSWFLQRNSKEEKSLSKVVLYSETELKERSHIYFCETLDNKSTPNLSSQELVADSMINEKNLEHSYTHHLESSANSKQSVEHLRHKINRNHTTIINYDNLKLTEAELNGFLTDRIISSGLSDIGCCPVSKGYVYTKLCLSHKNLSCVTQLQFYRYLQIIDLSHNHLEDISALSEARYLQQLNVSYNLLRTAPGFSASLHLNGANFSHNMITDLEDFADFSFLQKLYMSHNYINVINAKNGLNKLRYLECLDLSYNDINSLGSISHLSIYLLNLEGNPIKSEHDVDFPILKNLRCLNLNYNFLTTVLPLKEIPMLQELEIKSNKLANLMDISHLRCLRYLMKLDLRGNDITTWKKYRQYLISTIPTLCSLDGKPISLLEKIAAKTEFDPDVCLVAACIQTRYKLLENWDQCCLRPDTFPIDQDIHPIIILVGPPGSSKTIIAHNIAAVMPDKVYLAVSHTTRSKRPDEEDGVHHHFVTNAEFSALATCGAFVCVSRKVIQNNGLAWAEITKAVKNGSVCISYMNLPAALQLYTSRLQPVLILTLPRNEDIHKKTLKTKYFEQFISHYDETTIEASTMNTSCLSREHGSNKSLIGSVFDEDFEPVCGCGSSCDLLNKEQYLRQLLASREQYLKLHAENPGLFIKTIYTDEPNAAVKQIKKIIQQQLKHHPSNFPSHPGYEKLISSEILLRRFEAFELELKIPC